MISSRCAVRLIVVNRFRAVPKRTCKLGSACVYFVKHTMLVKLFFCFFATFCIASQSAPEENPYLRAVNENYLAQNSIHDYVEVRPGAHLFYWFFYADGTKKDASRKPLIIWIQGGPGFAASGVGNFGEFGPLTMDMQPRNHTWVKGRNLLLIDHPVGAGFSYVTSKDLFVKTDQQMAIDLSRAIKLFFKKHKVFRKTPAYVIGQSYGGKLCPRLAVYLYTAIKKKSLKMNFKGIGIGGGWVNPKESTLVTPRFLYHTGAIDRDLYLSSSRIAHELISLMDKNDYIQAHEVDFMLFKKLNEDEFLNFNNIYGLSPYPALVKLNLHVNQYVKPTLKLVNQTIDWLYLNTDVYDSLKGSLLVPSFSFLEKILSKTNLKVVIYNGNFDVVTPLAGASNWVHKLNWPLKENFTKAVRHHIRGTNNGYYKEMEQLSFWSVFRAGHWVPEDNPEAMEHILEYLLTENN